jgi:hypothetical protein
LLRNAVKAASRSRWTAALATRFAGSEDVATVDDGAALDVTGDSDVASPADVGLAVVAQPTHVRPMTAADTAVSARPPTRAETPTLLIIASPSQDFTVITG